MKIEVKVAQKFSFTNHKFYRILSKYGVHMNSEKAQSTFNSILVQSSEQ
jgi:hypothetical protein